LARASRLRSTSSSVIDRRTALDRDALVGLSSIDGRTATVALRREGAAVGLLEQFHLRPVDRQRSCSRTALRVDLGDDVLDASLVIGSEP
jgi:carbamoylphosphate synthase small subunit